MAASDAIPIKSLAPFNFQNSSDWPEWIQEFEDFRFATGLNDKPQKSQVCTLLYSMGREARKILASFGLSDEDQNSYDVVKGKFDSHFVIRYNEVYESAKFNLRKQQLGETVDQFATALYSLAEHCNFGTLKSRLIRDRFVVGLSDRALSETLQLDSNLTLETAIEKARQKEAVKLQQQNLLQLDEKSPNINAIKRQPDFSKKKANGRKNDFSKTNRQNKCCYCGGNSHPRPECPANQAVCRACQKHGHFAKVCISKKFKQQSKVSTVVDSSNSQGKEYMVGGIATQSPNSLHVKVTFNKCSVNFKVDSGAEVSIVKANTPGVPRNLQKATEILRGPDGSPLKVIGKFDAVLNFENKQSKQQIFVVDQVTEPLLGWPALRELDIIKITSAVQTEQKNQDYYLSKYPQLFSGLGKMSEMHTIILEDNAVPYSVNVARRVPIPMRERVKVELDRLQSIGVIRRVTKPTDWCAGLVPVEKPSGDVRICVDYTQLNKWVAREKMVMPTVEESLGLLGEAKVFTKLDANSGFYQIPLSENSQDLTTFITPFGRYCFTRLPFGITSAPEHFQQKMAQVLEGLPGVVNQTDDTLVVGRNQKEHDNNLEVVLKKMSKAGITLNLDKCQFSVPSVTFLGHVVDKDGIRPDPAKISAIQNLTPPVDVSGVRRILGMVNHVARFMPHLSSKTEPLRALLNKNAVFQWESSQEKALKDIKETICSPTCLAKYNPSYETVLSSDASSFGLGSVLMQKQPSGELRAVAYASRSMTTTETRYSQIEKEALASTWAAERFQQFLLGLHFTLETDHKPLVPLLGKMNIEDLPPRIQRFRIRLMRFNYDIVYVPGQEIATADTLSRSPEKCTLDNFGTLAENDIVAYVAYVIKTIPASAKCLNEIKEELKKDYPCSLVVEYCTNGWPEYRNLPSEAGPFWKHKEVLTVSDGLLMKGPRLVVPKSLQKDIISRIHDGHLGIVKCRERAKESVWWPGLSTQIKEMVTCCSECVKTRHQNAEPLIPTTVPTLPWERVASDLFEWQGKRYLLVTDYYSRFPEICQLASLTSAEVIEHLKAIFARHGIPDVVVSDNGPQYSSAEFKAFSTTYGFNHVTSSPRYPQANGEAERMVQTMKNVIKRSSDPYLALLSYRNTPGPTGSSPAQLSMGRRLRTRVPVHPNQLQPKWPDLKNHHIRDLAGKQRQKVDFDKRHAAHELKPLNVGDRVWIPDAKTSGIVMSQASTPRSYVTQTPRGENLRRNRRHLIPMAETSEKSNSRSPSPSIQEEDMECLNETVFQSPKITTSSAESMMTTRSGRQIKKPQRLDL